MTRKRRETRHSKYRIEKRGCVRQMKKKSQSYVSHTTIQEANNELKLEKRNTDFESSTGLARITPSTCGNTISCQNQSLCTI